MPPEERWTLLLVEDEPLVLELLMSRLQSQGYHVLSALNGQAALDLLATLKPHLIICDVVMPVMDGPTLCRKLRAQGDHTPFLFLTAKGQPEDIVDVLAAGADDYLIKPFNAAELNARIKAILRRMYPNSHPL